MDDLMKYTLQFSSDHLLDLSENFEKILNIGHGKL
jgi:hypothetical protein